jgi:hypothetical protein
MFILDPSGDTEFPVPRLGELEGPFCMGMAIALAPGMTPGIALVPIVPGINP